MGTGVQVRFDSLDRFDDEDLAELSNALPSEASVTVAGTSSPTAAAGVAEVIAQIALIAADGVAIAQAIFFLRDKLRRSQVVRKRGTEIEVEPDRALSEGHVYVETPDGLKVVARPEDLAVAIEALRNGAPDSSPDDEDLLRLLGSPDARPTNSVTDQRLRELDVFLRTGFQRGLKVTWPGPILTYEDPSMKQLSAEVHFPDKRVPRVTLHPGWMPFAGVVANVLDAVLPPGFGERPIEREQVRAYAAEQIESAPRTTGDRFAAAVIDAVRGSLEPSDLAAVGQGEETERARILRNAADAFVVGHEYAHIMLGHLSGEAPPGLTHFQIEHVPDTDRRRQERQADAASLMAVSWALDANGFPAAVASLGALVFFALQAGVEVARPRLIERGVAPAVDVAGVYPDVYQRMGSALDELERDGKAEVTGSMWESAGAAMGLLLRRTEALSAG
jgi:hypothetical protein